MLTLIIYKSGNGRDLKTLSVVEALISNNLLTSLLKSLKTTKLLAAEGKILNTLEALS